MVVDKKLLEEALQKIITKKNELSKLDYNDDGYDDVEDELHDLEDDFNEEYGDYLEDILHEVHDELCPDSDVLLPTAYLANEYNEEGKMEDGDVIYKLSKEAGVCVDVDDYIEKDTRLLLLPNPARIWLIVDGEPKEELWSLKRA